MAETEIPSDLSSYTVDPCFPLPSDRASRNHMLAKEPIQPTQSVFPADKRGRKFLTTWYKKYGWLEYSKSTDKAFCFYCRIFNKPVSNYLANIFQ